MKKYSPGKTDASMPGVSTHQTSTKSASPKAAKSILSSRREITYIGLFEIEGTTGGTVPMALNRAVPQEGRLNCAVSARSPEEAMAKIHALMEQHKNSVLSNVVSLEFRGLVEISKLPKEGIILNVDFFANPTLGGVSAVLPEDSDGCDSFEPPDEGEIPPFFVNDTAPRN